MHLRIRALLTAAGVLAVTSMMLVFTACGGDSSSGGTGTDEAYVSSVCKAMLKFSDSLNAMDPTKLKSEDDAIKAITGPFDQLLKDLKAAKPPKDVKSYHDEVVATFQKANDQIKKNKDMSALTDAETPEPPPAAIKDRLQKIADKNADCKKADFNFGE